MVFITVLYDLACHKPPYKNHITPDHADDNIIQTNILLKLSNFVITGMVLTAIETTGTAH